MLTVTLQLLLPAIRYFHGHVSKRCLAYFSGVPLQLSEPSTPLDWTGVTTNSEECSYSSESRSESDENETNRFASVVGDVNWNDEVAFSWESHGVSGHNDFRNSLYD